MNKAYSLYQIICDSLKNHLGKTTLKNVWNNTLMQRLNLKSLKILKLLHTSTRNALMLVLEPNLQKVRLKHIWVSVNAKNKFSTSSMLWAIWKLPLRKRLMETLVSLRRRSAKNLLECIKRLQINFKRKMISIKLYNFSKSAQMLLKELNLEMKKQNAINRLVTSKKSQVILTKQLSISIDSLNFAKQQLIKKI